MSSLELKDVEQLGMLSLRGKSVDVMVGVLSVAIVTQDVLASFAWLSIASHCSAAHRNTSCSIPCAGPRPAHPSALRVDPAERHSASAFSGSGAELQIHWQAGRRAGIFIDNIFYPVKIYHQNTFNHGA